MFTSPAEVRPPKTCGRDIVKTDPVTSDPDGEPSEEKTLGVVQKKRTRKRRGDTEEIKIHV